MINCQDNDVTKTGRNPDANIKITRTDTGRNPGANINHNQVQKLSPLTNAIQLGYVLGICWLIQGGPGGKAEVY